MGKTTGFLEFKRKKHLEEPAKNRVKHYKIVFYIGFLIFKNSIKKLG